MTFYQYLDLAMFWTAGDLINLLLINFKILKIRLFIGRLEFVEGNFPLFNEALLLPLLKELVILCKSDGLLLDYILFNGIKIYNRSLCLKIKKSLVYQKFILHFLCLSFDHQLSLLSSLGG